MTRPPGRRRGSAKAPPPPRNISLTIDHIGHRGDGVARTSGGTVFVPNTLPGETVRASVTGERGTLIEIVRPAPDRIDPFCRHFTVCGGCTSQHMDAAAYPVWKRGIVEIALRNRGVEAAVEPLVDAHGAGRRRATLHARLSGGAWVVGYSTQRSHHVIDLDVCPILTPELANAPDVVRAVAATLADVKRFDVQLTQTDGGIDLRLTGLGIDADDLDLQARTGLAEVAHRLDLARIAIDDDTILTRTPPRVRMGTASVVPPPGAFLQATAAGEQILGGLVTEYLTGARRTADLFSGLGPFALRLAAEAAVDAFDSDAAAIAALSRAVGETTRLRPIKAEARDLFIRPLIGAELDRFDGVVFDPPRAGAEAQSRTLAASKVPVVVAVSCDSATFARDAALLLAGGYRLERVTPIDQFKWSPHVEIVGLFRR